MTRALMLDVDGVIVRPKNGRHWSANLERDLGVSAVALQNYFFRPHWERTVTGRSDLHECLGEVLRSIAPVITPELLMAYWFQNDAELDELFLRDLAMVRSSALQVYLATNQEHTRVRYLMDVVGLRSHVDGCYYSAAMGHMKPHRAFFEAIQSHVGLPPADLLLVDDAAENVAAAIAAGWSAERWTPAKALADIVASYSSSAFS